MDFWRSRERQDEADDRDEPPEPSFFRKLTDYVTDEAKDMAIASVVEHLTDGWITYDSEDEHEPRDNRNRDSFEERLQRSLAELASQPGQDQAPAADSTGRAGMDHAGPAPDPSSRPAPNRAQGFGRKGL